MATINSSYTSEYQNSIATSSTSTVRKDSSEGNVENKDHFRTENGQSVSTIARQLAAAADRAAERDQNLTRTQLSITAKNIINKIGGDLYSANKKRHDNEVPSTDDPELLARAKQATQYINNHVAGNSSGNPFAGLSHEQLANIIYDESGTFTVNERHAAWLESYHQEEIWRQKVCRDAQMERDATGKSTNFYKACLEHYNGLPVIEQSEYPANYAMDLQGKINSSSSEDHPESLLDIFFKEKFQQSMNSSEAE